MGVTNTVACLDAQVAPVWHDTVHALRPGLSYLALYLGFDGDIAAAGATAANVWIYEVKTSAVSGWRRPTRMRRDCSSRSHR
jgi:all-trans-retinol 13,14-reductase